MPGEECSFSLRPLSVHILLASSLVYSRPDPGTIFGASEYISLTEILYLGPVSWRGGRSKENNTCNTINIHALQDDDIKTGIIAGC